MIRLIPVKQPIESAKEVANATTEAITKTASFITSGLLGLGKGVFAPMARAMDPAVHPAPGAAPGIEQYLKQEDPSLPIRITVLDYGNGVLAKSEFEDIHEALVHPKPENPHVRWINIDGLRASAINAVSKQFGIHTLSAEDVINTYQRPKLEVFEDHFSVIARQIQLGEHLLKNEQITFFLFKDTLISFQEETGDVFGPVRKRLENTAGLSDLYQSSVGNKMNEIMKVLTIMASFFIPITFFAGVYGMNFEHIPELGWKYAYPVFWGGCLAITFGLAIFFWRKGWIGPNS